ncbi:MAG: hypothetical protein IJN19_03480 [Opitutales bacterium]|nr:hypothetical protein [Opitutales bacterium]
MAKEKDPWLDTLEKKTDKLNAPILLEFEEWNNSEKEADELIQAANNFSPERVVSKIEKLCEEIAQWYVSEHNKLIKKVCKEIEIKPTPWLSHDSKDWLYGEVVSELKALENALNHVRNSMCDIASFVERNTGFWANAKVFIDSAIKGAISPLRSMYDYGKDFLSGFENPEAKRVDSNYERSLEELSNAQDRLSQVVYAKCISRWNDKTLGAIKDIDNSLLPNKVQPAPSILKRCFWGIIKLLLLTGFILGGMTLLEKYKIINF